jgi:transposase InsO family protein
MKVSQRRACTALGWARSSIRYVAATATEEQRLVQQLIQLSRQHPRYGYRRMTALLRRDGWRVNQKRVQRLWREHGLKVPPKQRKRRRLGTSAHGATRRRAEHRNHVWSYDFVEDRTADGRKLKLLPIVDEFTRECLTIEVERSMTAREVVATLEYLFELRGAPQFLRSDNGPEFIAQAVRQWLQESMVGTLYIAPGSPWENPYSESFHSRLRDELLNREVFDTLDILPAFWTIVNARSATIAALEKEDQSHVQEVEVYGRADLLCPEARRDWAADRRHLPQARYQPGHFLSLEAKVRCHGFGGVTTATPA